MCESTFLCQLSSALELLLCKVLYIVWIVYNKALYFVQNDFYVYDITSNQWTLISEDTSTEGGPPLIFDHQVKNNVVLSTDFYI